MLTKSGQHELAAQTWATLAGRWQAEAERLAAELDRLQEKRRDADGSLEDAMNGPEPSPVPERHAPPLAPPVPEGVVRPFVSVLIPTYNRARLLTDALESVLL